MEEQIADLNTRLQEKEAQIVKIKKDMYDLQELTAVKDRYLQAKELSLSMIQRGKSSTPNSDEYAKEFKAQSLEFQSLKVQLKNAYEEIARLKERSTKSAPQDNDNALSKGDRLREKLKQALDEIDEQGRVINALVQKLRDAGQSVDLSQYFAKQ